MYQPKSFVPAQTSQPTSGYQPKSFIPQKKSVGGFIGNVAKSAVNNVAGIGSALLHPIQTAKGIGNTALGAAQLLVPGEQGSEQYARDLGNFYKQRYGGLSNIGETLYNDPVGVALDASTLLGGAGALAKGAGSVSKVGGLSKLGRGLSRAGSLADPFQLPGRAMGKMIPKAGKAIETQARDFSIRGYGQPQKLGKFADKFRPAQEVIGEYGLYGKDLNKLDDVISQIQSQFDDIARKSGRQVSVEEILNAGLQKAEELKKSGFTEDIAIAKQLEDKMAAFIDANPRQAIDIGEATKARLGFDKRVKSFALDPTAKGSNEVMRDLFQEQIRKSAKGLQTPMGEDLAQTGKRLNELYSFKPIMEQAAARGTSTRPLNLGRMVTATAGAASGGLPGMVAGFAADTLLNSPQFVGATSKIGQKVGQALQKPMRTPATLKAGYGFGLAGRFNLPTAARETRETKQLKTVPKTSPSIAPIKPTPMVTSAIPKVAKEIKYTPPKNVFKNKSAFGKKIKLGGN